MKIYVKLGDREPIAIEVTQTMQLVELMHRIFKECERLNIWRLDGKGSPKYFKIIDTNNLFEINLGQKDLNKTLAQIGINDGDRIETSKTGGNYEDLSWEVLLHYVTNPHHRTDENIVRGLLQTKIAEGEDSQGYTALHFIAQLGLFKEEDLEITKHQINTQTKRYVSTHFSDSDLGIKNTPLHIAAFFGHKKIVARLLDLKDKVGIENSDKNTALHIAAEKGYAVIVGLLLSAGAKVNVKNKFGQTPLHCAVSFPLLSEGHVKVVHLLLAAGAEVNALDNSQQSPLYTLVNSHNKNNPHIADIFAAFIDAQVDINMQDMYRYTPLYHATRVNLSWTQMLVEAGAKLNVAGMRFYDAKWEIQKYLLENGVEVSALKPDSVNQPRYKPVYDEHFLNPIITQLLRLEVIKKQFLNILNMPKVLIELINEYVWFSYKEYLAIAHQHRKSVYEPLFQQAEIKSESSQTTQEIQYVYDKLMQSEILLEEKIKEYLVDGIVKNISTGGTPYKPLYIAIAEIVGVDYFKEVIKSQPAYEGLEDNPFAMLIKFLQDSLLPGDPFIESPEIMSDDFFSVDSKYRRDPPSEVKNKKTGDSKTEFSFTPDIEEPIPVTLEMVRDTVKDLILMNQSKFNQCAPTMNLIDADSIKEISNLTNFADLRSWLSRYWSQERSALLNELLLTQMEDPLSTTIAKDVYTFLQQFFSAHQLGSPAVKSIPPLAGASALVQMGMFSSSMPIATATPTLPAIPVPSSQALGVDAEILNPADLLAIAKLLQKDVKTIQNIESRQTVPEILNFYSADKFKHELEKMQEQLNWIPDSKSVSVKPTTDRLQYYIAKLKRYIEQENELEGKKIPIR